MGLEFSSLPVRCELADDESGYGFLLRSARANGMGLAQLMAYTGTRSLKWPQTPDIEVLAFLTCVQPSVLACRLRQRRSRGQEIAYQGSRWRGSEAFRVKVPQVCPLCLQETGRCLAVWEFSAYCVCVKHRQRMVDCCARCRRPLSWLRPAVDICSCGRYLASRSDDGMSAQDVRLLAFCLWLERGAAPFADIEYSDTLPGWLVDLGADGAFHVLRAFGWRMHIGERISAADAIRTISPTDMISCLGRAFARVEAMGGEGALPRELAYLVDEARIERLACNGTNETARRFAKQLLRRMLRQAPLDQLRRTWRASRPAKGQLELFDDA